MLRKRLVLGALWVMMAPHALLAQRAPKCGDLPEFAGDAEEYRTYLSAPQFEWLRTANGFQTLAPDVVATGLSDEQQCTKVRVALQKLVRQTLKGDAEGRQALKDGYRYRIYIIGPYYVVPVQPTDSEGGIVEGYEIVNVFLASTLDFVGDFLR